MTIQNDINDLKQGRAEKVRRQIRSGYYELLLNEDQIERFVRILHDLTMVYLKRNPQFINDYAEIHSRLLEGVKTRETPFEILEKIWQKMGGKVS